MNVWMQGARLLLSALAFWAGTAQAHIMVAQKGTINIKGASAYLMMSLPVSAFTGFDDDGDGQLSMQELQRHAPQLQQQFLSGAQFLVQGRPTPFELLVLNLSAPDDRPGEPASQLLVMGRYAVPGVEAVALGSDLRFAMKLFGAAAAERLTEITFTAHGRTQVLTFTPKTPDHALFVTGLALAAQQVQSGAVHVLGGADHLLFLLVVLAEALVACRGVRHAVLLLTAFTLGHGLTLAATVLGHVSVSPRLVEPAIAATIVVMAAYTLWQARRGVSASAAGQLALVSACALVHGLGLGDALRSQGWSPQDLPWALAGFNIGIEFAQLGVAAVAAVVVLALRRTYRGIALPVVAQVSSLAAFGIGVWWLVERTLTIA